MTDQKQASRRRGLLRHPALFAIAATVAFIAAVVIAMPPYLFDFEQMSPERKIEYLEHFTKAEDDLHSDIPALLRSAQHDNPRIIIAGATDENPEVRKAGLKALASLLMVARSAVDFEHKAMPALSEPMQEAIDEIALTGIRAPQGEDFELYQKIINQLMTNGDRYHAAVLEVIDTSDDTLQKAQLWFNLFFTLGPQADAKPFILQTLSTDSDPTAISFASNLAQGLLDPDFIQPLAAIAANTELPHTPRHRALTALATYGGMAQDILPLLQGLPQEEDWDEDCREDAAQSIRSIETDTPRRTIYLTLPDGTPWRNITPLW